MNKITLFIIILTTLFYFTFTLKKEPFKICKKGPSVEPVSVYQIDLDNKLSYDYFDNQVIRLLNDYFDRKLQVVIEKFEKLDYKNNLENTYHHYNNLDTNANYNNNNIAVPISTNLTYISNDDLDKFIENDMKIFNYLLRNDPESPVLQHLVKRILPPTLDSPINILVIPHIKGEVRKMTVNDKTVILLGFFSENGRRNIRYFSNNLPKNWIRNYEKNLVMVNKLSQEEKSSKLNSTERLEELKVKYYLLKEQLHGFKDTIKKHDEIERRLIKEFNILSREESSELTLTNNNLKLELNEYNIVKQEFDETYKEIMKFYEKPRENKAIVNKNLLIAKAEVNKYKVDYEKLPFIKELGGLLLDGEKQAELTTIPDKCSIRNDTINSDLCEESKKFENLDFNKVDEGEQKTLFGKLGLNNYLSNSTSPIPKCDSKYLSSFDDSYL